MSLNLWLIEKKKKNILVFNRPLEISLKNPDFFFSFLQQNPKS